MVQSLSSEGNSVLRSENLRSLWSTGFSTAVTKADNRSETRASVFDGKSQLVSVYAYDSLGYFILFLKRNWLFVYILTGDVSNVKQ